MPGILCQIKFKGTNSSWMNSLDQMIDPLVYYDWYKIERLQRGDYNLAIVHLGIFRDVSIYYFNSISVILHGEIYNDLLEYNTQTEYIYNKYTKDGINCVESLNGSFSILILDERRKKTFIVTDKTASRPLFYTCNDNVFSFAPEIKSLLRTNKCKNSSNINSCLEILVNYYNISNESIAANIYYIDYASIIEISETGFHQIKYWDYIVNDNIEDKGLQYYSAKLSKLIEIAVVKRLMKSDSSALLLSGGIDSRAILGYAKDKVKRLNTIAYGLDLKNHSDLDIAKKLSNLTKTNHYEILYSKKDILPSILRYSRILDGMGTTLTDFSVYKYIRENTDSRILLAGDEAMGWRGDSIHSQDQMLELLEIYRLTPEILSGLPIKIKNEKRIIESYNKNIDELLSKCHSTDLHNQKDYFYVTLRIPKFINMWRYAISTELEIRNPLLDDSILDFMRNVPVKYRKDKSLFSYTIEKKFPALFKIESAKFVNRPTKKDYKILYRELVSGKEERIDKEFHINWDFFDKPYTMKLVESVTEQSKKNILTVGLKSNNIIYNVLRILKRKYKSFKRVHNIETKVRARKWSTYPDLGLSRIIRISHFFNILNENK